MDIGHDSQIPRIRARSTLPHSAQWEVLPFFCLKNHTLIGRILLNTMVK